MYAFVSSRIADSSKRKMNDAQVGSSRQAAAGRGLNSGWSGWSNGENRLERSCSMACVTEFADGNWCKWHCRSRIEGIILDSDIASVCRMSVCEQKGCSRLTSSSSCAHSLVSSESMLSSMSTSLSGTAQMEMPKTGSQASSENIFSMQAKTICTFHNFSFWYNFRSTSSLVRKELI